MSRTQWTHVEVVLLTWQQLPEELLRLTADWTFIESRFYRIAQADMVSTLTLQVLGFFEQLKDEKRIADFCSRVVVTEQTKDLKLPDTGPARYSELPEWIRP